MAVDSVNTKILGPPSHHKRDYGTVAIKGRGLSIISANKSQTFRQNNGQSLIGLSPLWPDVCDLIADTILKPSPLLLL